MKNEFILLAAFLTLAQPAFAQDSPSKADVVLDQILMEGQVMVTCFSLDTANQPRNIKAWETRAERTLDVLGGASYDAAKTAAFRDAALTENLLPKADARFSEVMEFCAEQAPVMQAIIYGKLVRIPKELEAALKP